MGSVCADRPLTRSIRFAAASRKFKVESLKLKANSIGFNVVTWRAMSSDVKIPFFCQTSHTMSVQKRNFVWSGGFQPPKAPCLWIYGIWESLARGFPDGKGDAEESGVFAEFFSSFLGVMEEVRSPEN